MRDTLLNRIMNKISPEPNSGCWLWTGSVNYGGYGYTSNGRKQKHIAVHRATYEIFKGQIPPKHDLDHKCRVRSCANPDHLEPVTRSENVKRGLVPKLSADRASSQTHCKHGHEFTLENTQTWMNKKGYLIRNCRECRLVRKRKAYHARKAANA